MQGMCDLLTSFAPACGIGDAVMMLLGLCMCLGQLVVDHGALERVDTISSCVVSAQRLEHAEVCDDGVVNFKPLLALLHSCLQSHPNHCVCGAVDVAYALLTPCRRVRHLQLRVVAPTVTLWFDLATVCCLRTVAPSLLTMRLM